jgi:hypothetical protein
VRTHELIEKTRGQAYATSRTGKAVRLAGGHSQTHIAGAVKAELADLGIEATVEPSTISRWESSERVPSGYYAVAYCRVIDGLLAGKVSA